MNETGRYAEEAELSRLYRELRKTRIISLVTSVLLVFVLAAGGFFYYELTEIRKQVDPVIRQVEKIDAEEVNTALEEIDHTLETVDWEQIGRTLGKLDVDALNTAIENLDTKEFTEALENLNDAVDTLEKTGESIKRLIPLF